MLSSLTSLTGEAGEKMGEEKVKVSVGSNECYFHVFGDNIMYMNLASLVEKHPECADYCEKNRLKLNMELYRQRELLARG